MSTGAGDSNITLTHARGIRYVESTIPIIRREEAAVFELSATKERFSSLTKTKKGWGPRGHGSADWMHPVTLDAVLATISKQEKEIRQLRKHRLASIDALLIAGLRPTEIARVCGVSQGLVFQRKRRLMRNMP